MIPSFHAVFGLRHRDMTAKVIDYKGQVIRAQGITSFTHGYCRFAWLRHNNYIGQTTSVPVLPISDAKHCNRSRKRLQPPLQSIATVLANVCNSFGRVGLWRYWPKADGYDFCSIPFRSCAKMAENSSAPCPHKCFSSLKYSGLSRYRPRV